MNQLVLWLNMISFALMTAAVGVLYLVDARTPRVWLRMLIYYTASYAVWLLFGTYAYVQAVFLSTELPALELVFAYVRVAVSFVMLFAGSAFCLRIAIEPWKPRMHLVTAGAAIVVAGLMIAYFVFGVVLAARLGTLVFNFYFCAISAFALRHVAAARAARRRLLPFLVFSTAAYAVLGSLSGWLMVRPPQPGRGIPLNVFATGGFTILWGALIIAISVRWISSRSRGSGSGAPDAFVRDFGISQRERDIVDAVSTGATSKEIGERLFISQRTVETHLYSVYRKCSVSNKVELLNLLARYGDSS